MTPEEFEDAIGFPLDSFAGNCHSASVALVHARVFPEARVARGTCRGVFGQHSWVVLGDNCYDPNAEVVDPTLWSYDSKVTGIWQGLAYERPHRPHGSGSIWEYGRPDPTNEKPIVLNVKWSQEAADFLDLLGPLDRKGWMVLANAPVEGWPAAEIIGAMYDDKRLRALIPIDIVGMLTDRNPGGLYLPNGAL